MIKIFDDLMYLVRQLREVELSIDKLDLIEKYPQCRNLLEITYNPFKQFVVTKSQLDKDYKNLVVPIPNINKSYVTIQHMYNFLNDCIRGKRYSTFVGIQVLKRWCTIFTEYEETLHNIVTKDLKCGINAQLINCIYPKLIPIFLITRPKNWDCICATRYYTDYVYLEKLEGERVYACVRYGKVNLYNGRASHIRTLNNLKNELQAFVDITESDFFVLEGHVLVDGYDGRELNKLVVRGSEQIYNAVYKVYDMFTTDEFEVFHDEAETYTKRHERLKKCGISEINMVESIPYFRYDNQSLEDFKTIMTKNNWRGVILRKDESYNIKISYNIIKIHPFAK